ncbi:50S ribosomal protein L25/general stress protein Ctc [Crocinitomicaceae bacterium]|jgi:large subunit ribosomal protein L25|nr:50S ribosomal protein L25/general stress protein Ctc [Crocinitomicaceae bacterium]
MKEVSLSGALRTHVGKKDAKAVRKEGRVPCVIYGSGEQHHFSVKHVDMEKLIYTPNVYMINLDIEGKAVKSIIQDIQYHPVTDRIVHVDFIELADDKKVKMNIPVNLVGRAPGVLNGGKLQQIYRKLKVVGYPKDMPDTIEVDINALKIGMAVRVRDISVDGIELLNAPSAVVCSVKMARGAVNADDDEEEEAGEEGAEAAAEGEEG